MLRRLVVWLLVIACCVACVHGARRRRVTRLPSSKHVEGSLTGLLKSSLKHAYMGLGTYYHTGMGSCGTDNSDTEMVVAVNKVQMKNGVNPNKNPRCQTKVRIKGTHGACSAKVVDTCPTCVRGDLDMSEKVFKRVCGNLTLGKCKIKWKFE